MALVGARGATRVSTASTPGRLRGMLIGLVALCIAWGVLAAFAAYLHSSAASNVVSTSEPLTLHAEQVYQGLSDADATAANGFLAGGLEPASIRQRYDADINQAAQRIEAASAMAGGTAAGANLATLSAQLPVYTGEVATAQADNRLGLPLGAAYLREASGLSRGTLLTAASDMYSSENALLVTNSAQATGLPLLVIVVVAGLIVCFLLLRSGRWLRERTHRVFNAGLLVALIAALVSVIWLGASYAAGRSELLNAQKHGSVLVETFAKADVAALRAHADESLTLIDNTGDDIYQSDYLSQQHQLTGLLATLHADPNGERAATDAAAWFKAHSALRALDNGGNHPGAVASARTGQAAVTFTRLSQDLTAGIAADQAVFDSSAKAGRDAFTGVWIGMIVAAAIMLAGCVTGINRRLAEYR